MNYKYTVTIESPDGQIRFSANSQESIQYLIDRYTIGIVAPISTTDVESAYRQFRRKYPTYNKSHQQSNIWKAGLEKEALKLYLDGLTVYDASERLIKEFDVKTSKSALWRYWSKFRNSGIIPNTFIKKEVENG